MAIRANVDAAAHTQSSRDDEAGGINTVYSVIDLDP
jgi:hypothetical protein